MIHRPVTAILIISAIPLFFVSQLPRLSFSTSIYEFHVSVFLNIKFRQKVRYSGVQRSTDGSESVPKLWPVMKREDWDEYSEFFIDQEENIFFSSDDYNILKYKRNTIYIIGFTLKSFL
jgi:hypothetical protein